MPLSAEGWNVLFVLSADCPRKKSNVTDFFGGIACGEIIRSLFFVRAGDSDSLLCLSWPSPSRTLAESVA